MSSLDSRHGYKLFIWEGALIAFRSLIGLQDSRFKNVLLSIVFTILALNLYIYDVNLMDNICSNNQPIQVCYSFIMKKKSTWKKKYRCGIAATYITFLSFW